MIREIDNELIWKSLVGNLAAVRKCLKQGANIHAANDLPLANAVHMNHTEVVMLLISQGANLNNYKRSAILSAGNFKMIDLLIEHGSNIAYALRYPARNHHLLMQRYYQKVC